MVTHPREGDRIYLPSTTLAGGWAVVAKVHPGIREGQPDWLVWVEERPEQPYSWRFLASMQAELRERYGEQRADANG